MKFFLIVFSFLVTTNLYSQASTPAASADPANAAAANSGGSVGSKYKCVNVDLTRRIEIEYEHAGTTVPCIVNYFKDQEDPGITKVLWRSENQEGFCEDKVSIFLEKLKGWGWSCTP